SALLVMSGRLRGEIARLDASFTSEYQTLVQQALYLAGQFEDIKSRVADHEALEAAHQANLTARQNERDDLTKDHNKVRADAKDMLRDLRTEQAKLFKLNADIRNAQDQIFDLEKQLRTLEERIVRAGKDKDGR